MRIYVEYEDTKNKYEIPIALIAEELHISKQDIERAILKIAERS